MKNHNIIPEPKFNRGDRVQYVNRPQVRGTILSHKYNPKKGIRYKVRIGNYTLNEYVKAPVEYFRESELAIVPIVNKVVNKITLMSLLKSLIAAIKKSIKRWAE